MPKQQFEKAVRLQNKAHAVRAYSPRVDTMMNRQHVVVPVVALREGVHCGTAGCLYYPADVINSVVNDWNGKPVPVYHPATKDGTPVSCNTREVYDEYVVGLFWNVYVDNQNRLRGELWLDKEVLQEKHPSLLVEINAGNPIEVSTGLLTETESTPGVWNGEEYIAIVKNMYPDHLALLPDVQGACSFDDGCGIRANQAHKEKGVCMPENDEVGVKTARWLNPEISANAESSIHDRLTAIHSLINSMDTEQRQCFLVDAYQEYFIYEVIDIRNGNSVSKFFKASYSFVDGNAEMVGEPVEVERKVTYENVQNTETKEADMPKKETQNGAEAKVKTLVDGLISNEKSDFVEDDRENLSGLSVCMLEKMQSMIANQETQESENNDETTAQNEEDSRREHESKDFSKDNTNPQTLNEFLGMVPPEVADVIRNGVKLHEEKRKELVEKIHNANPQRFPLDTLNHRSLSDLEDMASLIPSKESATTANFFGQSGVQMTSTTANNAEEPLEVPSLDALFQQ